MKDVKIVKDGVKIVKDGVQIVKHGVKIVKHGVKKCQIWWKNLKVENGIKTEKHDD